MAPERSRDGHVPMVDLAPEIDWLGDELRLAIANVLGSGRFILGPNVAAFEEEMASFLGAAHAVGVNSGTDALVICLRAAGITQGDEVVTTPFTFFATAEAICSVGATPVFADINPDTFNIDPDQFEACVTQRTKAVLPVHLYGRPAEIERITAIADACGLVVVEDAAQALGACVGDRRVGTFGRAAALSFFPSKNLGGFGDGGMVVTDDPQIAAQARSLRAHGSRQRYSNETIGYNSRLDELQAALLRVKLPYLDAANFERRKAAERYGELLADLPDVRIPTIPVLRHGHVFHQYTLRLPAERRDTIAKYLAAADISTMVYYPIPVHRLPVFAGNAGHLFEAELAATEVLSIPLWPSISGATQEYVAEALMAALAVR